MIGCFIARDTATFDFDKHASSQDYYWEFIALFDIISMRVDFNTMIVGNHLFDSRDPNKPLAFILERWINNATILHRTEHLMYKNWLLLSIYDTIHIHYIKIVHVTDHNGIGKEFNGYYKLSRPIERIYVPMLNVSKLIPMNPNLPFMNRVEFTPVFNTESPEKDNTENKDDERGEDFNLKLLVVGQHSSNSFANIFGYCLAVYLHQSIRLISIQLSKSAQLDDAINSNSRTVRTVRTVSCYPQEAPEEGTVDRYDTFGIKLSKNKTFWRCFANKWLEFTNIEFVNNRYIMFIGGNVYTSYDNRKQGIWNTIESRDSFEIPYDRTYIMSTIPNHGFHIQYVNRYEPVYVCPSSVIMFDFVTRQWSVPTCQRFTDENNSYCVPTLSIVGHHDRGTIGDGKYNCIHSVYLFPRVFKRNEQFFGCCIMKCSIIKQFYSFDCVKFSFEAIEWDVERVIWIGFNKNKYNQQCHWSNLPKDIVKYILKLSKFSIFEKDDAFVE